MRPGPLPDSLAGYERSNFGVGLRRYRSLAGPAALDSVLVFGAIFLLASAMHVSSSRHVAKTIAVTLTGCQTRSSTVTVVIFCPENDSKGKMVGAVVYNSAFDGTSVAPPVEGTSRVIANPAYHPTSPKYWKFELIAYLLAVVTIAYKAFRGWRTRRLASARGHFEVPLSA
jgi:hypothetical protein